MDAPSNHGWGRYLDNEDDFKEKWNHAAEAWVDFVRMGKDYTRHGLNNPAAFALIGEVRGLEVLDLACGEGYNTRILARRGAKVVGADFSKKMIELAKQEESKEKLGISYHVLDAANLIGLPDNRFDIVACFMALQDVEDYRRAVSEVSRVLKLGGRFVFSIPHPCFEKVVVNGEKIDAAKRYFEETTYEIQWDMKRLSIPFRTISFHRTLTDYFDALSKSSLYVSQLVEPRLSKEACQKYPYLQEALVRPQSVIIESVKLRFTSPMHFGC